MTYGLNAHKEQARRKLVRRDRFNNYKNKLDILRNCKKLKVTNLLVFEDFSKETASIRKEKWEEVLRNEKVGKISYLQYKTVICKERTQVSQISFVSF